jgi:glucose dehydrogenase
MPSAAATTSTPTASSRSTPKQAASNGYYQDATETPVVVDANWESRSRKLLLHANRKGLFYVSDLTDGKMLLAKHVHRQTNLGERHQRRRPPQKGPPRLITAGQAPTR